CHSPPLPSFPTRRSSDLEDADAPEQDPEASGGQTPNDQDETPSEPPDTPTEDHSTPETEEDTPPTQEPSTDREGAPALSEQTEIEEPSEGTDQDQNTDPEQEQEQGTDGGRSLFEELFGLFFGG